MTEMVWANRLTVLRGLLTLAVWGVLLVGTPWPSSSLWWTALALFLVTAATDAVDGAIARRFGDVSVFGRIADPLVDKLLVLGTMVVLLSLEGVPAVLPVWAVIRSTGRSALAAQVDEDLRLARLAADLLREDERFELTDEPQLSIVAFRHRAKDGETEAVRAARDLALMEATLADGTCMLSTTVTGDRTALRLVVMNHRTGEGDVRRSVACVRELAG